MGPKILTLTLLMIAVIWCNEPPMITQFSWQEKPQSAQGVQFCSWRAPNGRGRLPEPPRRHSVIAKGMTLVCSTGPGGQDQSCWRSIMTKIDDFPRGTGG